MKLSTYQTISTWLITKRRIENDLALLEEADHENFDAVCVEFIWVEFPKNRHCRLFESEGGPRLWADNNLHAAFSKDLRALARRYLEADLESCHAALGALGIELDET